MTFQEIREILKSFLGDDRRPVLAYTGLLGLASVLPGAHEQLPSSLLDLLVEVVGSHRSLLMPTYTNGFRDGLIDLDHEPCNTGMINQLFRLKPGVRRTASAYWSFAVQGPQAEEVASLRPIDAWGEGSLFEWVEQKDAHLLMLGVPWSLCSFLHRVEWLVQVPYRYPKTFSGQMIRNGKRQSLEETLFVRFLDPLAENQWSGIDAYLEAGGMRRVCLGRGQISHMRAQALLASLVPILRRDPFAFLKNPERLRVHYGR